ncbi:tRNA-(ms[2]io[6]A)-hydroxylase [Cyclobacterium xiamenense]|uniref:tRNA-(Ms[2]io[6]A)-hydroxylase n=1 Tax=Cyclobacterium xiamenense TaxID=1297121 RepID=A0A1H6UKP8_9BACT|nr:tRNA-(ms[2]io[6]A)-hydroxylase [Cyclobacterium xiamenense]SEI92839.1 tRNA-(ms[2]io[6]A)-hydroxylase [Cyclobacterium xiamenense]
MKYSIELKVASSQAWLDAVMTDFDAFLQDHADCERKAAAMATSLIAKYPDRVKIIPDMIETAIEELEHFHQVFALMQRKGIPLNKEMKEDPYIKRLTPLTHGGTQESRFLSRMLLGSIVECRGCERFRMVSEVQSDEELKRFYKTLWTSEAKHGNIFVALALEYFDEKTVYDRLHEMMEFEGKVVQSLPIAPALH